MKTEHVQTITRKLAQSLAILIILIVPAGFILLPGTGSALREGPLVYLSLAQIIYGLTLGLLMYLLRCADFMGHRIEINNMREKLDKQLV